jgi:hypothetical protein
MENEIQIEKKYVEGVRGGRPARKPVQTPLTSVLLLTTTLTVKERVCHKETNLFGIQECLKSDASKEA